MLLWLPYIQIAFIGEGCGCPLVGEAAYRAPFLYRVVQEQRQDIMPSGPVVSIALFTPQHFYAAGEG